MKPCCLRRRQPGHINPALATANYIRSRYPDTQVLFIGSPEG